MAMRNPSLLFPEGTPQWRALERAVNYGERLRIEPKRKTVTTLQGNTETGWIVYGSSHSGDGVGILFPSKQEAQDVIDAVNQAEAARNPTSNPGKRMFRLEVKHYTLLHARDLQAVADDRRERGLHEWQFPLVAYYIDIIDEESFGRVGYGRAEALYVSENHRLGIAWGADADWGDVDGVGDIGPAIDDWLNDRDAWEARN